MELVLAAALVAAIAWCLWPADIHDVSRMGGKAHRDGRDINRYGW